MNKLINTLSALLLALFLTPSAVAEHLIVVGANDTHSQIDPAEDGLSGLLRQRVVIDDLRDNNKNFLAIHAGDAVQGTLYFSMFRGNVEYPSLDSLGYDAVILGNHEFDNGLEEMAKYYSKIKAAKLCANYDFSGTAAEGLFQPYIIKRFGNRRVGVFGLNVVPFGLISDKNFEGMRYLDNGTVAEETARYLKEVQKVDFVIMASHIGHHPEAVGQTSDSIIASKTRYIDMIIGGHTHTLVKPGTPQALVKNADGTRNVVIGQNGKWGKYFTVYDIDLDDLSITNRLVKIDASLDAKAASPRYDAMRAWLAPYKFKVDSVENNIVAHSAQFMSDDSHAAQNWLGDAVLSIAPKVSGVKDVDLAIMNVGGIRKNMPKGEVSEGLMRSMFPFSNRFIVMKLSGKDLLDALQCMATRNDHAVSSTVKVVMDGGHNIKSVTIKGKKLDPKKTYTLITIDYLANGGDHMDALKNGERLFVDKVKYGEHMLNYVKQIEANKQLINSKDESRFIVK